MSEIRIDLLTNTQVIVVEDRADRPIEFQKTLIKKSSFQCPFCAGNETDTPQEIEAFYSKQETNGHANWTVRVIPNKYPALTSGGQISRSTQQNSPQQDSAHFPSRFAAGSHELVILSAEHKSSFSELTATEVQLCFKAFQNAVKRAKSKGLEFLNIFMNCGFDAGATIEHAHVQMIGLPFVPPQISHRIEKCEKHFESTGRFLQNEMLQHELDDGTRVIDQSENFSALAPFASRSPFQTLIAPLPQQYVDFDDLTDEQMLELGLLLQNTINRLESVLHEPAYNFIIQLAPLASENSKRFYRWSIEIFPRLTRPAGFEWGTQCWLNPVAPETAAEKLRAVSPTMVVK